MSRNNTDFIMFALGADGRSDLGISHDGSLKKTVTQMTAGGSLWFFVHILWMNDVYVRGRWDPIIRYRMTFSPCAPRHVLLLFDRLYCHYTVLYVPLLDIYILCYYLLVPVGLLGISFPSLYRYAYCTVLSVCHTHLIHSILNMHTQLNNHVG